MIINKLKIEIVGLKEKLMKFVADPSLAKDFTMDALKGEENEKEQSKNGPNDGIEIEKHSP